MKLIPEIKRNIQDHMSTFLNIFSEEVSQFIKENCFIAGGAFISIMHSEPLEDIDIYFKSDKAKEIFEDKYEVLLHTHMRKIISTDNAHTYERKAGILGRSQKYQFITKLCGSPLEVVLQFDFEHCMCYYDIKNDEIFVRNAKTLNDKMLLYNVNGKYPVKAMERYFKFINRGYKRDFGVFRDIVDQIKLLDLTNKAVIKEQQVGLYDNTKILKNSRYLKPDEEKQKLFKSSMENIINEI